MAKNEHGKVATATTATSATPKMVAGLLDIIEAEANGESWIPDDSDPLASIGLGLGASLEARRLALLGLLAEVDEKLADLKPKRGAPKKAMSISVNRAAAVLGADDFLRRKTGKGAGTQKKAIEVAAQIDRILCETEQRNKPLFGKATTMERLQNSVSEGLRELGVDGERFTKK